MKTLTKSAISTTRMVLEISPEEKAVAIELKDDFKAILKQIEEAVKVVNDFTTALTDQHPSQDDLKNKYRGRLLRYRLKVKGLFNAFLVDTKAALEKLTTIADPNIIRLREVIIAEISELSDGAGVLLDLLKDVGQEGWSQKIEKVNAQMQKRLTSIKDVIQNQLENHIDHDIMGRLKISEIGVRIKKRSELLRGWAKEGVKHNV